MGSHAASRLYGQLNPGGAWAFWGILAELFSVLLAQELHSGSPEEGGAAGQSRTPSLCCHNFSTPGGDPIMRTFPSLKALVESLHKAAQAVPVALPARWAAGSSPASLKAKPLPFPAPDASFSSPAMVLAVLLAILLAILLGSMGVFFVKVCWKNPELSVGTVWSTLDDKEYLMSNAYTL